VWRGGSMMAVALTLLHLGVSDRDLYLYDTYEGMSAPTDMDVDVFGRPAAIQFHNPYVRAYSAFDEVKEAINSTGYPAERIKMVKGKVEDTIPGCMPETIALLRLDTDWYASTIHELHHLYPRLSLHGPMIIDDYGFWQGSRQAVDEYFAKTPIMLHYMDYSARIAIKTCEKV
jgi:O-methyltransferase